MENAEQKDLFLDHVRSSEYLSLTSGEPGLLWGLLEYEKKNISITIAKEEWVKY